MNGWPTAQDDWRAALRATWTDHADELRLTHARAVARGLRLPDALVGIPTPAWKQWWQRHVTRRP